MNKLDEKESKELYEFLHDLKKNNWCFDRRDIVYTFKIIDWHLKVTGLISAYDEVSDPELFLSLMVKDMCDYFKREQAKPQTKKCNKCRKTKGVSEFFDKRICRVCYKKNVRKRK